MSKKDWQNKLRVLSVNKIDSSQLIARLLDALPSIMAVYGFGSRITGHARADSDLDVAVLVEGYVDPLALWELAQELAILCNSDVDLIDLRAASTVMQYQILTQGECWWARDASVALYEAVLLNEKLELDGNRAGLLHDIATRGSIYGR